MSETWVIAPYFADKQDPDSVIFDHVWDFDLRNSTIAIGWNQLGDVSKLSKAELIYRYHITHPNCTSGKATHAVNMIWAFYHEIDLGDTIIARKGRKKIIGVGKVIGSPFYDVEQGICRVGNSDLHYYYPNFLPVQWQHRVKFFSQIIFSMSTLYQISYGKSEFLLGE